MVLQLNPLECYARIQRKIEGRRRSCAVEISTELVENLDNRTKTLNFNFTASIEIEEAHHRKCRQQKLLSRFWGMVPRATLLALFSWVLRKLTTLVLFGALHKLLDWL